MTIKALKSFAKKILIGQTAQPIVSSTNFSQEVIKTPKYHLIRAGNNNPDKIFYIIQRSPGSGFFSNFAYVVNHLKIADKLEMIPYVDFLNFTTLYNEISEINGTYNAWEYYFEQVSPFSFKDVYSSKFIAISDSAWYSSMPMSITADLDLLAIRNKYIKLKPDIIKMYSEFVKTHFEGNKILGVHFRGQELRSAVGHPFPPTKKQIVTVHLPLLDFLWVGNRGTLRAFLHFAAHPVDLLVVGPCT